MTHNPLHKLIADVWAMFREGGSARSLFGDLSKVFMDLIEVLGAIIYSPFWLGMIIRAALLEGGWRKHRIRASCGIRPSRRLSANEKLKTAALVAIITLAGFGPKPASAAGAAMPKSQADALNACSPKKTIKVSSGLHVFKAGHFCIEAAGTATVKINGDTTVVSTDRAYVFVRGCRNAVLVVLDPFGVDDFNERYTDEGATCAPYGPNSNNIKWKFK